MRVVPATRAVVIGLCLFFVSPVCHAALAVSDFQAPGDRLLVSDSATGLIWLSPRATNTASYNAVVAGFNGLVTTQGFRVATANEVLALLAQNFNDPTTTESPDNVPKAQSFFATFGIAANVTCSSTSPPGACPRTQGFSLTPTGDLRALGMITIGNNAKGNVLDYTVTVAAQGAIVDDQRGTWLVRSPSQKAPATPCWAIVALGLAIAAAAYRGRRTLSA